MDVLKAVILAIVEGITEFLPISSTGHMILVADWLDIQEEGFTKLYIVVIQLGAILSVVVLYWKRFFKSLDFYLKLLVAFIPAVVFGLLFNDLIDRMLGSSVVVAVSLILGGIILLFVDRKFGHYTGTEIDYKTAFRIGMFQTLAMIPGISRSGATIVGGMLQKLSRKTATEFSFFLAVPTMLGATVKKTWDFYRDQQSLTADQWQLILLGNAVAFVVALLAIRSFIKYVSEKGFRVFGIYRIALGLFILLWIGINHGL
ncbi:MAG: undecaprenyl-diphosphate phosphatase [Chlorobi bacterium]|nr:undecaprenyl-diphosphate phosphatase [Chlorobiota bacterium]